MTFLSNVPNGDNATAGGATLFADLTTPGASAGYAIGGNDAFGPSVQLGQQLGTALGSTSGATLAAFSANVGSVLSQIYAAPSTPAAAAPTGAPTPAPYDLNGVQIISNESIHIRQDVVTDSSGTFALTDPHKGEGNGLPSQLDLGSNCAPGITVQFDGNRNMDDQLQLRKPMGFQGTISQFDYSDRLELSGMAVDSGTYTPQADGPSTTGVLDLFSGGTKVESLQMSDVIRNDFGIPLQTSDFAIDVVGGSTAIRATAAMVQGFTPLPEHVAS